MMVRPRSILITGASSGIGRALAVLYAAPGVRLALVGRNEARLRQTADTCRAKGAEVAVLQADVRERIQLCQWIRQEDDERVFDLVIPVAGVAAGLRPGEHRESSADRQAVFATNVDGVINTVEPLIDRMCARGRGQIAFMGSIAGYRGLPYCPSYCASKAAIHVYAEALRAQLRAQGVIVSLVVPGFVATAMNENLVAPAFARIADVDAARIIRDQLAAGRAVIVFPRYLGIATRLLGCLPRRMVDAALRQVRVVVPEITGAKAATDA